MRERVTVDLDAQCYYLDGKFWISWDKYGEDMAEAINKLLEEENKKDKVCGNCLFMRTFNPLYDFGFCRRDNELRLLSSSCWYFKDFYTLKELKAIEDERKRLSR